MTALCLPDFARGKLELRLVSLAVSEREQERLQIFLTDREIERGKRLLDDDRRRLFFAGRGILREMLAGFLGEEPARVEILEGEFGKPRLHERFGALRFNISHSGALLLAAFSTGGEVGVDLEEIREELEYRPMAERYFSPAERQDLAGVPLAEQRKAFYRCWTRKEAYLKATGSGFSQPSTCFDVTLLPGRPPALLAHRGAPGEPARWALGDVEVQEGFCAALALARD